MKATPIVAVLSLLLVGAHFVPADPQRAPGAKPGDKHTDRFVADLIKDLESDRFDERQTATEWLIRLGRPSIDPLKKVLAGKPGLETTRRVHSILRIVEKGGNARAIRAGIGKPVDLPDGLPAGTSLMDALDFLSERTGVAIAIDADAFQAADVMAVAEAQVHLKKMMGVSLGTILKLMLPQIKCEGGTATYVIRRDALVVTTTRQLDPRNWTGTERKWVPRTDAQFDQVPLQEAVRELVENSGINIVLDARVGEKHWATVSATATNLPVDTLLELLADMADLKVVVVDSALYVTSRANALAMRKEQEERAAKEEMRDSDRLPNPER